MARDTGSFTLSTPPVVDPAQVITATATNNTTAAVITYTTASDHNLKVGQPVITKGFSNAWLNYNPDSGTGNGTPAVVASVTSPTVFTVKLPAVVATDSSAVSGTIVQSALVSNSPYAALGQQWLPTTAQTNVQIAHEWSNSFPIQPNDDRSAGVPLVTTAPSGSGTQITYTVASGHGLVAGQTITINGVVPNDYNLDTVTVASTTSTTIVVNGTAIKPVTSFTNGNILAQLPNGGVQASVTAATGATQAATVTPTPSVASTAGATTLTVSTSGVVVGMALSGTNIATGSVVTAIGTGTITFNPPTTGIVSSAAAITMAGNKSITYVTSLPHNLSSGEYVNVSGSSVKAYNVNNAIATVVNAKTFSVPAPSFNIKSIATAASSVTLTTQDSHGYLVGDFINVSGVAGGTVTAINTTSTAISAVTDNTITYTASSPVLTGPTAYGVVIKSSGTFSGSANVIVGDTSWGYSYDYPSGPLNSTLDSHEIAGSSLSGYPDFTPGTIVPNVVGLTLTNASQRLLAAGLKQGSLTFSSDLAITAVSTAATNVTYTTGTTTHYLNVGDTVNLSGGSVAAHNLGDVNVASVSGFTFTVNVAGVTGTVGTSLVVRPKNTEVSAQTPAAGSTIADGAAKVVALVRNYGL